MANKWYRDGLPFACTECGQCCTGSPGYVWVQEAEVEEMAAHLGVTPAEFSRRYLRRVGGRLALVESKKNYDCVFLKERKCLVYKARPSQCRTFPWWPENLTSPEAWKETAKRCEGIRDDAPRVKFEAIEEQLLIQLKRRKP